MDGNPSKVAVNNLSLAVSSRECFGLLGANGAGKSTTIHMLTGFLTPTSGTCIINGIDISQDPAAVYRNMGLCPQHDLLWEQLTGVEHLYFYGRLKGVEKGGIRQVVEQALESVNLGGEVGRKRVKTYSGGMKRRLSVAISMMGTPPVVYLDEPSTGLDPASRRGLWRVVQAKKAQSAIILTTHSMQEAEVLCDRIGIVADGKLVCVGNPKEITARYGGYYVLTVTTHTHMAPMVTQEVTRRFPAAKQTYAVSGTAKFEVPCEGCSLSEVFDWMEQFKPVNGGEGGDKLVVLDWGVTNATLEEVFIAMASKNGGQKGGVGGETSKD